MTSPLHPYGRPSEQRYERWIEGMWTTTTGTNLYVLDGGIARTHGTIIPGYQE